MTLWEIFDIEERREPINTPGTVHPHHSPSRAEMRGVAPEGRGRGWWEASHSDLGENSVDAGLQGAEDAELMALLSLIKWVQSYF